MLFRSLKKKKIDVDFYNGFPIRGAVDNNKKKVVKYLLDNNCDISIRRYKVVKNVLSSDNKEMFKLLIKGSKYDLSKNEKKFLIKLVLDYGVKDSEFYINIIKEK